jgi:hypothetical protein
MTDPAAQLTEQQLGRFRAYLRAEDLEVGGTRFATGDASYDLIVIESGAVELTREATPGLPEMGRPCAGLFCFIGADPAAAWLTGISVHRDGFIRTDLRSGVMTSAVPGRPWGARPCRSRRTCPGFSLRATCATVP